MLSNRQMRLSATSSGRKIPEDVTSRITQRYSLHALARIDHRIEIADDEFLTRGQIVAQQLKDDLVHDARVKDAADQCHHQYDEGEEREDRVGCDGECKSMHFGPQQVLYGREYEAGRASSRAAKRRILRGFGAGNGRNGWTWHEKLNRIRGAKSRPKPKVLYRVTSYSLPLLKLSIV